MVIMKQGQRKVFEKLHPQMQYFQDFIIYVQYRKEEWGLGGGGQGGQVIRVLGQYPLDPQLSPSKKQYVVQSCWDWLFGIRFLLTQTKNENQVCFIIQQVYFQHRLNAKLVILLFPYYLDVQTRNILFA
eukprot:TRINITY_DN6049_c0_g1_i1.p5 TRINITY_DN6049_c0_g1~~TRINITY_DN6049_c0_g1_i1.p5  ORF type:complete len:129 (-),score=6.52 TRINITY_DN6049_c0_g1_i1:582-968(-)